LLQHRRKLSRDSPGAHEAVDARKSSRDVKLSFVHRGNGTSRPRGIELRRPLARRRRTGVGNSGPVLFFAVLVAERVPRFL